MASSGPEKTRATLRAIYDSAVAAVHPQRILVQHLPEPGEGRVILLAAGKAGAAMLAVAERYYLDDCGLNPDRLAGIAVVRYGYGAETRHLPVLEAGHPVPDEASTIGASKVLEFAAGAGPQDLVIVLLSGGGSANWNAPAGNITLAEKQQITRALLRSGASISEINTVRKRLSRLKGGRLARIAAPARLLTLAISDVPHDDPTSIASGPTVPDPTTSAQALAIAGRRGIDLPPAALELLRDPANETPKPGDPIFANTAFRIIGSPDGAMEAAERTARAHGYEVVALGAHVEGEAASVARQHARLALEMRTNRRKIALISGGELTVTMRGAGRGGPNQEYALGLAIALEGAAGISGLAGDTDGTDGGSGAADDPAGAFVFENTLRRATDLGLDAGAYLAENDSTAFFEKLGDLLTPGPTLTNVNDCRVILVEP